MIDLETLYDVATAIIVASPFIYGGYRLGKSFFTNLGEQYGKKFKTDTEFRENYLLVAKKMNWSETKTIEELAKSKQLNSLLNTHFMDNFEIACQSFYLSPIPTDYIMSSMQPIILEEQQALKTNKLEDKV